MIIIYVFIKWNGFWNGKIGFYGSIHTSGTLPKSSDVDVFNKNNIYN